MVGKFHTQVLNKDVALARLAQRRVALAPHDAARAALDVGEVQLLQRTSGIGRLVEVHVGVAQRTTRDGITRYTNRGHGADGVAAEGAECSRILKKG